MGTFAQIAESRRSIRKYEDKDVDTHEILECLRIATTAPSGCNSQCWKFMLIHNKKKIADIADLVTKKEKELLSAVNMKYEQVYFDSRISMLTFFKNAPVCIAVYMTRLDYYDKKLEQALCEFGYTYDGLMELFGFPDLLSVGAAIQNLLLALSEKGYGACWMNDPVIAKAEISQYLGMTSDEKLVSLIPVGIPAFTPKGKKYKDFNDVVKVIE